MAEVVVEEVAALRALVTTCLRSSACGTSRPAAPGNKWRVSARRRAPSSIRMPTAQMDVRWRFDARVRQAR